MSDTAKARPVYRNINVTDITSYRLPLAGLVSILHRISGAIMFLLLPFVIWMFDASVSSEYSFARFTNAFDHGVVKLIALGLIWAFLHHFVAGVRHVLMDARHTVAKEQGQRTAIVTLVISIALTLLLGAKLFGLF